MKFFKSSKNLGFTMMELLIVIVVMGILATLVLVMLDPVEQMARGRDNNRRAAINGLSAAMQSYISSNATYPATSNWANELISKNEIKSAPPSVSYRSGSACTTNPQNGYCYNTNGTYALVYAKLESRQEQGKCTSPSLPYFLWASGDDKSGLICSSSEPSSYSGYTYK